MLRIVCILFYFTYLNATPSSPALTGTQLRKQIILVERPCVCCHGLWCYTTCIPPPLGCSFPLAAWPEIPPPRSVAEQIACEKFVCILQTCYSLTVSVVHIATMIVQIEWMRH